MKKERLFYLDFVRTIAVIAVFACHYTRELETAGVGFVNKILPDFVFNVYLGSFGVSLFFIISGASLMYVYNERCRTIDFYKKRFWSIYPMYWLAYILAFLYNFWINRGMNYTHPKISFGLTLVGMDGYLGFYFENYYLLGEWFLGCLIFLYLLFPLLRIGVLKHPKLTFLISMLIYIPGVISAFVVYPRMPMECMFFLRIPELLFGMYFIEYIKKVNWQLLAGSSIILVIAGIFDFMSLPSVLVTPIVGIASFVVIVFISQYLDYNIPRKFCDVISKYSYAIFLSHHFLMMKILPHFNGIVLKRSENYMLFVICIGIVGIISKILVTVNDKLCIFFKENVLKLYKKDKGGA